MDQPPTNKGTGPRIGNRQALVFILCALFLDGLSVIPGLNILIDIGTQMAIPFAFKRYGVDIFSAKKVIPYIAAWVIEAVPEASIFPAITIETALIIWMSRREDQISK